MMTPSFSYEKRDYTVTFVKIERLIVENYDRRVRVVLAESRCIRREKKSEDFGPVGPCSIDCCYETKGTAAR